MKLKEMVFAASLLSTACAVPSGVQRPTKPPVCPEGFSLVEKSVVGKACFPDTHREGSLVDLMQSCAATKQKVVGVLHSDTGVPTLYCGDVVAP